jgi:hypothetical protein
MTGRKVFTTGDTEITEKIKPPVFSVVILFPPYLSCPLQAGIREE